MNCIGFKYVGAALALAVVSACSGAGGASSMAQANAAPSVRYDGALALVDGRPVTAARPRLGASGAIASLQPEAAKTKYFDYIINDYQSYADIFDYPTGVKQVGTIQNVGGQGCSNVLYGYGKGIVWIVAGADQISEYSVPTKLLRSLTVPSGQFPSSCAMDKQGDLAVGILAGSNEGDVAIFKDAKGTPTYVPSGLATEYFDGYDDKGNLFFDGFTQGSGFQLDEVPKGSKKSVVITPSDTIGFPGSVQWDGKYVTVLDQYTNIIHQYTVTGTKATVQGTVTLSGASDCAQTWIATGVVYCGDAGNDNGSVYRYPKGGKALAVFAGNFDLPLGTVAAEK